MVAPLTGTRFCSPRPRCRIPAPQRGGLCLARPDGAVGEGRGPV